MSLLCISFYLPPRYSRPLRRLLRPQLPHHPHESSSSCEFIERAETLLKVECKAVAAALINPDTIHRTFLTNERHLPSAYFITPQTHSPTRSIYNTSSYHHYLRVGHSRFDHNSLLIAHLKLINSVAIHDYCANFLHFPLNESLSVIVNQIRVFCLATTKANSSRQPSNQSRRLNPQSTFLLADLFLFLPTANNWNTRQVPASTGLPGSS